MPVLFHENQYGVNRIVLYRQTCMREGRRAKRPTSQRDISDPGITYKDHSPTKTDSHLTTKIKKYRPCTYNITSCRVRATIVAMVAMEKEVILHYLSVCS